MNRTPLKCRPWAMELTHLEKLRDRAVAARTDLATAVLLSFPDETAEPEKPPFQTVDGVAVIEITGVIYEGAPSYAVTAGYATDPMDVRDAVRAAVDDAGVDAIYLYVDSPGGYIDGTDELADAVWAAGDQKPVHAHIANLGASAAYWVASQAGTVSANRTADVGSIGVYAVLDDWSKAFEEAGVKTHVISSGKFKGTGIIGAPITDEQLEPIQERINTKAGQFVDTVVRGRKDLSATQVTALATGRTWVAPEAAELGLIDRVETAEEAFAAMVDDGPQTSPYQTGDDQMGITDIFKRNKPEEAEMADEKDVEAPETDAADEETQETAAAPTLDVDELESDLGAQGALDVMAGRKDAVAAYRAALSAARTECEKLRAEIERLQGEARDLKEKVLDGAEDIEHAPEPQNETFMARVQALQKEESLTYTEAATQIAREHPELYVKATGAPPSPDAD